MKEYHSKAIRNVAILGHLGCGKTTLAESFLFACGAIDKKGEVEKKNTVGDYTIEEQTRQTTLSASLIPAEWKGCKINFLDVPGSEELIGELDNVLQVVKGAILVLDASKGIEVGAERCWEELRKRNIPTLIYLNKMDKEGVKYEQLIDSLKEKFGKRVAPFCYPLGKQDQFDGFAMVVENKARLLKNGVVVDGEIYDDKKDKCEEIYNSMCEAVAETSEEMMDKYFSGEPLTQEEVKNGLRISVLNGDVYPVFVGSATKNIGVPTMLDMVIDYLPAPDDLKPVEVTDANTKQRVKRETKDSEPLAAFVFKTIVDPFVGTINLFKIYSGVVRTGMEAYIPNIDETIKMPQIFSMMGKTQLNVDAAYAGDIIAVSKLPELQTGYTICDKKNAVLFDKVEYATPVIYTAIQPKQKQDEEKISSALQKISQEDPTFEFKRNPETSQLLIGGQGVLHIGYILDKMKNTFKVEVGTEDPKIVYRETIRGRTMGEKGVQGRHKKQSGGAGQFGDVWIKFEPCDKDFEFAEEVFGGAVPKNYFPAVEKGLQKALEKGPLAGFPVIGVKATLVDGSYHPVDSNEISFVLAAGLAWQAAIKEVKPTILEPIMEVKVTIKNEYVGTVMGDMSKRRGRILGQDDDGQGKTVITAEVPEAEIIKYATELKAMTQASGRFSRSFLRYDIAPEDKIKRIIEENKQQ
ncbi:MAG: elongation factor G [Bacilli bacterium]|nr:elongation factor G [Bacilli bacterium]